MRRPPLKYAISRGRKIRVFEDGSALLTIPARRSADREETGCGHVDDISRGVAAILIRRDRERFGPSAVRICKGNGRTRSRMDLHEALLSHRRAFRRALVIAQDLAARSTPGTGEPDFWDSEIQAFDAVYEQGADAAPRLDALQAAMAIAREHAEGRPSAIDEMSYWEREAVILSRIQDDIELAGAAGAGMES